MTCYSPLHAYLDASGTVHWSNNGRGNDIYFPCGQCIGCRLQKSAEWATRIVHETKSHSISSFITLTYGQDLQNPSLHYPDFQLFLKRLRKQFHPKKIRYFVAGEYGDENGRPHWHAILFGVDFPDQKLYKLTRKGHKLYKSALLARLWPHGFSTVAEVNYQTAQYCAKYTLKKITGDAADDHYKITTPDGEIIDLVPEFARMSTHPGIGHDYCLKHHSSIIAHDFVVSNGARTSIPRYYDKLTRRNNPDAYLRIKSERSSQPLNPDNILESRLHVRETVLRAAISQNSTKRGDFNDN